MIRGRVDQCSNNKALADVRDTLRAAGLTANLEKCEFRKKKIDFFGLIFSATNLTKKSN